MAIIIEEIGDIFTTPPTSILIHACNARGAWGSGIAVAFKQKYPYAFRKYNAHCMSSLAGSKLSVKQHQASIVGTTFLIPPPRVEKQRQNSKTRHYIACLFTSLDYGKRVSSAEVILENTDKALKDLSRQVAEMKELGEEMGKCYAVRINSGKFGVEWQKTKAVLEAGELDITVLRPEEEEKANREVENIEHRPVTSGGAEGKGSAKAAGAEAEGPALSTQTSGAKRKLKANIDGDDGVDHERPTVKQLGRLHPGIAKRRKKLGLDG